MEKAEIDKILELHRKWLNEEEGGECADLSFENLCGANLSRADLSGADLSHANLFNADLSGANLFNACLSYADLSGADLSDAYLNGANLFKACLSYADLSRADLSGANLFNACLSDAYLNGANLFKANLNDANLRHAVLHRTNLSGANLFEAYLFNADLSRADLSGADLSHANLNGANLFKADLSNIRTNEYTLGVYPQCPEEGSFIGYKKARGNKIVVLKIPEDAKRSSATTFKCRCSKAEVLRIENIDDSISDLKEVPSAYNNDFVYRIGETVYPDSFDENRWNECSHGIHFFISRELARIYET